MLAIRTAAVRAVLARAQAVVGVSRKETKRVSATFWKCPHAELNLEQTLENTIVKPHPDADDLIVHHREQKQLNCALMLDTSLSMSGEKLALLAVAVTVLAYRLPSTDFAVIAFESAASTLKRMRAKMSVEQVAKGILEVPAMGYTNIEAALVQGIQQLGLGFYKDQVGILLTDGKYTAGESPIHQAARYRTLHVVLLGDFNTDPEACRSLAATGHGRLYKAQTFNDLPRTLYHLLNDLLA
jgi:Mg-chelatase subunit ChlD